MKECFGLKNINGSISFETMGVNGQLLENHTFECFLFSIKYPAILGIF